MRISDWSSDVCSSDLEEEHLPLGNEDEDGYLGLDGDSGGDLSITTTTAKGVLSVLVDPGKDAPALFGLASDTTPLQDQNLTSGGQPLSYAFSGGVIVGRSEEHTSELKSLMRISYAVFCLKKK